MSTGVALRRTQRWRCRSPCGRAAAAPNGSILARSFRNGAIGADPNTHGRNAGAGAADAGGSDHSESPTTTRGATLMHLSPDSEAAVAASAGVVAEHAEEITTVFYRDMFEAHPDLLNVFNVANQAVGEQPKALAASVVAFAVNLTDPDAPDFTPIMQRIAHKHVSLGIRARQYTIVGRYLLGAVGKVLGDAVTPEIAAAWDEVYWLFATSLIAEEAKLYAEAGTDPDQPWRQYRVVERFEESEEVFSLLLAPVSGQVPGHRTGQYVAIAVDVPGGTRQPRQYTISSGPRGDSIRVTIKRVRGVDGAPDGQVSGWLHENAVPGTVLDVSQPAGAVILDESASPVVLVSAGIGISPDAAIL